VKILHLFNEFLPLTEHWIYDLMMNTSYHDHYIYAQYYNHLETFEKGVHIVNRQQGLKAKTYTSLSKSKAREILPKIGSWIGLKSKSKQSLKDCIKEHKISLVHVHFGTTAAEHWKELKHINVPLVVSFYGWDYNKALSLFPDYNRIYKDIFKKAAAILVEGPYGSKKLERLGATEQKINILPLGIDISKIELSERKIKNKETLRLIQIASFTEKKGQLYSVKALHQAKMDGLEISLTLVGDDRDPAYMQKVRTYIKDNNLEKNINLNNWIDFEKIQDLLSNYDVFIHPSLYAADGDCEGGSPVILLLAQACGLPIISSVHCDIPNQTIENKTALLAAEGNVDGIYQCIQKFYWMNDDEYLSMSNHSKAWAKSFDVSALAQSLTTIYSSIQA